MTLTAALVSKYKETACTLHNALSLGPSAASMTSTVSFRQKISELDGSINPGNKMTYPGPSMLDG